jgi:hypothetical protein
MLSLFHLLLIRSKKFSSINTSIISRMIFSGELDRYKGFHVKLNDGFNWSQISSEQFESSLEGIN